MGLDITLYEAERARADDEREKAWDVIWERKESGEVTEAEAKDLWNDLPPYQSPTEVPSERYPEHLFNRRYLRSSYNGGGFNNAVPNLVGQDHGLYWIFEPLGREWDGDEGWLSADDLPALRECKARAEQVARELASSDRLRVTSVSANQFGGAEFLRVTDDDALAKVREQLAGDSRADDGKWWGSKDLDWFGCGIDVVAMVPGGERRFFSDDMWPTVHVVYRASDDGFASYVQSAEITAEFCDEAAALIERDGSVRISWSG
jgi:hypothetical protein